MVLLPSQAVQLDVRLAGALLGCNLSVPKNVPVQRVCSRKPMIVVFVSSQQIPSASKVTVQAFLQPCPAERGRQQRMEPQLVARSVRACCMVSLVREDAILQASGS